MLSKAQLDLYQNRSASLSRDGRVGAKHKRYYRGFVARDYGPHRIKFYPLKLWPRIVGVNNQTLRTWMRLEILRAFIWHQMPVMCLAEQHALAKAVQNHHMHTKHGVITDAFRAEVRDSLLEVRLALDTLTKPDLSLTERQRMLLSPSLNDR